MTRSPFDAHIALAMAHAEPAVPSAGRALRGLDDGAPFYWLRHPEISPWIQGGHACVERGEPPFCDFAGAAR